MFLVMHNQIETEIQRLILFLPTPPRRRSRGLGGRSRGATAGKQNACSIISIPICGQQSRLDFVVWESHVAQASNLKRSPQIK